MKYPVYETDRLTLRPTTEEDAPFILELLNTPKWLKNIGDRNVKTLEAAEAYIKEKMMPQFDRLGFSNYTVTRKEDGVKIGTCGLYDREGLEGVDIGFAFLPAYEKMGYGYESALKMKELAFSEFNIHRIGAITAKHNKASQRLIEKLGLTFDNFVKLPNEEEELMLYTIFKNED